MTSVKPFCLLAVTLVTLSMSSCKKAASPDPAAANKKDVAGSLSALSNATLGGDAQIFSLPQPSPDISVEGGGSSFAHVTFKPAVKSFELSDLQSGLQGISSDGHGLVFKNAAANIKALQQGDIIFVKGELAAKVLGNVTDGDTTLVMVGEARLAEVVESGEINIDAPVKFHGPKLAKVTPPPGPSFFDRLVPPVYAAQSGLQGSVYDNARANGTEKAELGVLKAAKSAVTDGWKVIKWSATPGDGQLNFQAIMSKDSEGFVAMVGMTGWIGNTDYLTHIKIGNGAGVLGRGMQGVKKTTGNIQFDWQVGKATPGVWAKEDRIKLPGAISVPLAPLLGGMPLTLGMSSALLIHPALTGGSEYSKGGFSVSWGNGNLETSKSETVQTDAGSADSMETKYEITSDTGVSPVAPTGMLIAFCAPRFELRLDVLGKLAKSVTELGNGIDKIEAKMMSLMPASFQAAVAASPLSGVTAKNILGSNADVYVQFVFTEGSTHSADTSPMPCSKQQIKIDVDAGGDAQLFGLTPGAKTSTNLYTKEYDRYTPVTDFCKKVGD